MRRDQEEGVIGKLVGGMIRRTLNARFRTIYWNGPLSVPEQCIFVANHHGWHDGYLMFTLVEELERRSLDWIQEYAAFPLFGKAGGMPFPAGDPALRAATLRKTIRIMQGEPRSLILFAEGVLHRGPEVWELGKALELVATKVRTASVIPVAIKYDMSTHERPEAYMEVGKEVKPGEGLCVRTRTALKAQLDTMDFESPHWQVLYRGTKDVNERWDVRKAPLSK